ncbi:cell wall hydrolase [Amaricoccus macauensis]|uniref:cell wall hydrolase n=1 Tax=Amaricoccus macauensis TaxID=57001 RepID=UPI003C7EAA86
MQKRLLLIASALAASTVLPASRAAADSETAESCLAEAIYFEARGESRTSREAVAHVIVNRAESEDFPDTICGVVNQGCQFSYNCDGLPETLTHRESREAAFELAENVLDGSTEDPTGGALFYHGSHMTPYWAAAFETTGIVGAHTFYR